LLSLILYLALRSVNSDPRWSISAYVSIVLITLVMVPLHSSSAAMMIVLFSAMALFMKARKQRKSSIFGGLALISLVCFVLYLISYASSSSGLFGDIFQYLNSEYLTIMKNQAGSFLNVLAERNVGSQWGEVSSFLGSVPPAFFLAIASIM